MLERLQFHNATHEQRIICENKEVIAISCIFYQCKTQDLQDGGAIDLEGKVGKFTDCTFVYCYSTNAGGAILAEKCYNLEFAQCFFESNKAGYQAGAILATIVFDMSIKQTNFSQNASPRNGADLTAFEVDLMTMTDCIITKTDSLIGSALLVNSGTNELDHISVFNLSSPTALHFDRYASASIKFCNFSAGKWISVKWTSSSSGHVRHSSFGQQREAGFSGDLQNLMFFDTVYFDVTFSGVELPMAKTPFTLTTEVPLPTKSPTRSLLNIIITLDSKAHPTPTQSIHKTPRVQPLRSTIPLPPEKTLDFNIKKVVIGVLSIVAIGIITRIIISRVTRSRSQDNEHHNQYDPMRGRKAVKDKGEENPLIE